MALGHAARRIGLVFGTIPLSRLRPPRSGGRAMIPFHPLSNVFPLMGEAMKSFGAGKARKASAGRNLATAICVRRADMIANRKLAALAFAGGASLALLGGCSAYAPPPYYVSAYPASVYSYPAAPAVP